MIARTPKKRKSPGGKKIRRETKTKPFIKNQYQLI